MCRGSPRIADFVQLWEICISGVRSYLRDFPFLVLYDIYLCSSFSPYIYYLLCLVNLKSLSRVMLSFIQHILFRILLCLDFKSFIAWILASFFTWISKSFFAWILASFFAWISKFFFAWIYKSFFAGIIKSFFVRILNKKNFSFRRNYITKKIGFISK